MAMITTAALIAWTINDSRRTAQRALEQDAAVLQDRAASPPLRAANNLVSVEDNVVGVAAAEAEKGVDRRWSRVE